MKKRKKVLVLYSGHQFDYLFGLVSAFKSLNDIDFEIVDAKRRESEKFVNLPKNVKVLKSINKTRNGVVVKILDIISYYIRLVSILLTTNADVIHIEWLNKKGARIEEIVIPTIIKMRKKYLIYKVHDINTDVLLNKHGSFDMQIPKSKRYFFRKVDLFLVHNDHCKKILSEQGLKDKKIEIIKHGINNCVKKTGLTKIQAREQLGIEKNKRVLLFFGTIAPYKGLENLLEAYHLLAVTKNEYVLIIAGNFRPGHNIYEKKINKVLNELEQKTKNTKSRIIRKIEFIENEEIETYFVASDVLCLPYEFIFQSGVLMLSYSFGLPVISRKIGGIPEIVIENFSGVLYDKKDELSRMIADFFSRKEHGEKPAFESDKIRQFYAKEYSWESIGKALRKAYLNN